MAEQLTCGKIGCPNSVTHHGFVGSLHVMLCEQHCTHPQVEAAWLIGQGPWSPKVEVKNELSHP